MTTRAELHAIGNKMEPLEKMLILPYPWTSMLNDVVLMRDDAIAASQRALANEASLVARQAHSPIIITVVPERLQGSILTARA